MQLLLNLFILDFSFFSTHDRLLFINYYFISLIFLVFLYLISCIIVTISYALTKWSLKMQEIIYEYKYGFEPFDFATLQFFSIELYIISIIFLIFTVEITLFVPWSLFFSSLSNNAMILIWIFLLLFALWFLYEINLVLLAWGLSINKWTNVASKKTISFLIVNNKFHTALFNFFGITDIDYMIIQKISDLLEIGTILHLILIDDKIKFIINATTIIVYIIIIVLIALTCPKDRKKK